MSSIVFFYLILLGYISCFPITPESFQFNLVDCIDDEISSTYVFQIKDFNDTCVKVNQTTASGYQILYYVFSEIDDEFLLKLKTENCSTPISDLHLTLCENEDENSNYVIDNSAYQINETSTMETITYTGATVYETLHRLNGDYNEEEEEEEDFITTSAYFEEN